MRGSSPRMTRWIGFRHAQARGISHALAQGARPALGGGAQGDGRALPRLPDPVRLAGDVGLQHRQCRATSARSAAMPSSTCSSFPATASRPRSSIRRSSPTTGAARRTGSPTCGPSARPSAKRRRPARRIGLDRRQSRHRLACRPALDPDGWVPHSMYARLQTRLPKLGLVSLDDMMEKLRTVKSAEEIAILEKAAAFGDLMLAACRDTARPGVKECEVYARMMEVMLANGGEEPTLFLWAADAHPYPHPFRVPTTRPLAKG